MRSGYQWNHLHLAEEFSDDSSVHRSFQRWVESGVLELIWEKLIEECEDLGGSGVQCPTISRSRALSQELSSQKKRRTRAKDHRRAMPR